MTILFEAGVMTFQICYIIHTLSRV